MHLTLDCIPCLVRQTLEAARIASDDPAVHETILRDGLRYLETLSFDQSPPAIGAEMHRKIRELLGVADPYKKQKDHFNQLAMGLLPALAQTVAQAKDPLEQALHLAIAGNVVDFGVTADIDESHLREAFTQAVETPLLGDLTRFRQHLAKAKRILYLADNTGEIVLDKLLIERLPLDRTTVAVRGAPVINDATIEDAQFAGITDLVPVISNGAAVPGTELDQCSGEFREHFAAADLIIAKGQGNYESLNEHAEANIAFLFRVKCAAIERLSGYPLGSHVLTCSQRC